MAECIEKYMQASGLPEGKSATTRKEFGRLVTGIPKLSGDLVNKTMQIKKALEKEGFSYDPGVFRAQNVIGNRKGNCLGLPLLAGSILGERGIQPKYKLHTHTLCLRGLKGGSLNRYVSFSLYPCHEMNLVRGHWLGSENVSS